MAPQFHREKILWIIFILSCDVLLHVRITLPLHRQAILLKHQILKAERKMQNQGRIIQKAQAMQKQDHDILEQFRQKAADPQVMADLLSAIESAAKLVAVHLPNVTPLKITKDEGGKYFAVTLTCDGSTGSVLRFVHALQNAPNFLDIEAIKLEQNSTEENIVICQMTLSKRFLE